MTTTSALAGVVMAAMLTSEGPRRNDFAKAGQSLAGLRLRQAGTSSAVTATYPACCHRCCQNSENRRSFSSYGVVQEIPAGILEAISADSGLADAGAANPFRSRTQR